MIINNPCLLDQSFHNAATSICRNKKQREEEYQKTDLLTRYNRVTLVTECARRSYRTVTNLQKIITAIVQSKLATPPSINFLTTIAKGLGYSYSLNCVVDWAFDKDARWTESAMTISFIVYELLGIISIFDQWKILPFALSATTLAWFAPAKILSDTLSTVFYKWTQLIKLSEKEQAIKRLSTTLAEMRDQEASAKDLSDSLKTINVTNISLDANLARMRNIIRSQELKLECLHLEKEKGQITGRWLNMILVAKVIEIATPILIKLGLAAVTGLPLMGLGFAISAYGLYKMYNNNFWADDIIEEKMDQAYRLVK